MSEHDCLGHSRLGSDIKRVTLRTHDNANYVVELHKSQPQTVLDAALVVMCQRHDMSSLYRHTREMDGRRAFAQWVKNIQEPRDLKNLSSIHQMSAKAVCMAMDFGSSTGVSPDRYARDNDLTIDSQIDPFFLVLQIHGSIPQPTSSGLLTDVSLPRLHLPTGGFQEQLEVPEESRSFLACALENVDIDFSARYQMPLARYEARKRLAEFKVDLPALISDTDYDCYELAKAIRKQQHPNLRRETIPLERMNLTNDEGLVFPDSARCLRRKIDQGVYHEKLDVPKEVIRHLVHALQDDWHDSENYQFLKEVMLGPTLVRNLAVTPPLSPYNEHEEDFIPDIDVCEVPVALDLSSMLSDDLKAAESAVLQKEHEKGLSPTLDTDMLLSSPLLDPINLFTQQSKISSIRMESPLSPMTSSSQCPKEGVDIPALLKSINMNHASPNMESSGAGDVRTDGKDGIFDLDLEVIMKESAEAVLRGIEQEHISMTDAVARVEVPVLDFSIQEPEWQSLPMDTLAHLKWLCERDPSQMINFPGTKEVPTSADYVWKRPGVAILRELEDEECLEEVTSPTNAINNLASLVRKRRLEMNAVEIEMGSSSGSGLSAADLVAAPLPLHKRKTNLLSNMESNSAVSTLLSNYIDLRTAKRRKEDKSSYFTSTSEPEVGLQSSSIRGPSRSEEKLVSRIQSETVGRVQKKNTLQAPCACLDIPRAPTKLIKGLTLSRKLFFGLEELYPEATIIERDFDRWNTVTGGRCSVLSSSLGSAEADVLVSPTTGIIVTTLLQAIQKPPPGHRGQSSIRERISCVALRYERLIVLVSEANAIDETVRDLTHPEAIAYAEFVGFTIGLDSTIDVLYVGGGEATLLKWLVSSAIRHAPEAAESQEHLIQDETQWELFLRRAGFNAYAAQAILGRLKLHARDADGEIERSTPSLAAFITMTDVERLQRFRDLMGGESVLDRVNKTLATKWH
ncbi:hypothetical protein FHL15_001027 [Xylaria flabelliformis]|uniref:Uncharacterized protein n=1 Tax=Xylaria flabelliformis TaxID=2512241 RepID=A0A553IC95_9PEZI|nr:hypothetical protein FHL15_001027 [Xylaria flabelliformis]